MNWMKKIRLEGKALGALITSAVLSFAGINAANAQLTQGIPLEKEGLLWKISGNGLAKASYLFGTIHLLCADDYFEPGGLDAAFKNTDQLVLEINVSDPTVALGMLTSGMMDDGKHLRDLISEEDYTFVDDYFKEQVGMPLSMLGRMKPLLLSSFTMDTGSDCQMASYELKFIKRAKEEKEEVGSLETLQEVMAMFDKIDYKSQAEMLVQSLKQEKNGDSNFDEMVAIYRAQDLVKLQEMIAEYSEEESSFGELLVDGRNENWMDDIKAHMEKMPSLIAVGAGHLPGKNGLINKLRKAGYVVSRVKGD